MTLLQILNKLGPEISIKEINNIAAILENMEECRGSMMKATEVYTSKMDEISDEISKWQKLCHHQVTHYQGDPSGGSDSETICEICGVSL